MKFVKYKKPLFNNKRHPIFNNKRHPRKSINKRSFKNRIKKNYAWIWCPQSRGLYGPFANNYVAGNEIKHAGEHCKIIELPTSNSVEASRIMKAREMSVNHHSMENSLRRMKHKFS